MFFLLASRFTVLASVYIQTLFSCASFCTHTCFLLAVLVSSCFVVLSRTSLPLNLIRNYKMAPLCAIALFFISYSVQRNSKIDFPTIEEKDAEFTF